MEPVSQDDIDFEDVLNEAKKFSDIFGDVFGDIFGGARRGGGGRSQVYRGADESGGTFFVEILTWRDRESPNRAHEIPAVMAVWEPMGMCCEARLGRPAMEFPEVTAVSFEEG